MNQKFCRKFLELQVYPFVDDLTPRQVQEKFYEFRKRVGTNMALSLSQLTAVAAMQADRALHSQIAIDYETAQKASDLVGRAMI